MSTTAAPRVPAVRLPRLAVGYLQSEGEMLRVPDQDLASFFGRAEGWKADLYTGRNTRALMEVAPAYDCVVVGYNAFYDSAAIRGALGDTLPGTGVLVLHQLVKGALPFLSGELGLTVQPAPEDGGTIVPSRRLTAQADASFLGEALLNWPNPIALPAEPAPWAAVERSLVPAPNSAWRSVLELERDGATVPVVLRTAGTRRHAVVVSTLILDYERAEHRDLLTNMLVYCAIGLPETAIVRVPATEDEPSLVTRKLRLQGAAAVETNASPLQFDTWPVVAASEVVLPQGLTVEDALVAPGGREWLAAGGVLMTLDEQGRPALTSGASDAAWVAQRWASWFAGVDPGSWQRRISLSHVVLRVLRRLHELGRDARADGLELPTPASYEPQVRALLRKRFDNNPHCEQTISTTAAAYELNTIVDGRALTAGHAARVADWLQGRFAGAHDVDRLTIARALGDADLAEQAVARIAGKPLPPLLVTHLCEAALATGYELPPLAAPTGAVADELERTLDGAFVLSARYLAAVSDYATSRPGSPFSGASPETNDRAIATLREFGLLARLGDSPASQPEGIDPEHVSHEALALLSYFGLSTTQTAPLRATRAGISANVAEYLVRESERLRSALAAEASASALVRRQALVLRQLLGVAAVALGAASFFAFDLALDFALSLAFALLVFGGAAGGLLFVGWAPPWLEPFLGVFKGGPSGAGAALANLLTGKRRERPEPDSASD